MRVLITGAQGFVGARLTGRLTELGHTPIGVDVEEMDVTDLPSVQRTLRAESPEAIIHLAGVSFVPEAESNPALACRINFGGSRNLLSAVASQTPAARVLLVGSGEQYAPTEPGAAPVNEEAPLDPTSVYALTKTAADLAGENAALAGLDVLRIRPFNHTGVGQRDIFVAPEFARQVAEIECGLRPHMEVGNLESVRDILHVDDVVDAYTRLLEPEIPAAAYNVASGIGTRIGDLIEMLRDVSTASIEVTQDPAKAGRPANARVGDAQRLQNTTGWRPQRTLQSTMAELLEHWRQRVHPTGSA